MFLAAASLGALLAGATGIIIGFSFVIGLASFVASVTNKNNPEEAKNQMKTAIFCAGAFAIFSALYLVAGMGSAIVQPDYSPLK